jgi:hypothetical protein
LISSELANSRSDSASGLPIQGCFALATLIFVMAITSRNR